VSDFVIKCAYTKLVPVSELQPYSRNRNKHPEDQIKRLAELIKFHGLRHPVIVSTLSNQVIAGNGRLEALKLLGATEIPVDYQDFESEDAEYTFSVSDNAIADWQN
jgi:ParB-like chromosome segregation protein Spo0J